MTSLACFYQAIHHASSVSSMLLDPVAFSEDSHWIEYKLLAFPTTLPDGMQERTIDKACRLGALLYMKGTLQEFPHSVTKFSILLLQVQESLCQLEVTESLAPLQLWLCVMAAVLWEGQMRVVHQPTGTAGIDHEVVSI
jgi:hypothetical protein